MPEIDLPNSNCIVGFLHCGRCLEEKPRNISPRDWAQLEVGWTPQGLQVWCRRHEINVMHVHFEGAKHPARTDCEPVAAARPLPS